MLMRLPSLAKGHGNRGVFRKADQGTKEEQRARALLCNVHKLWVALKFCNEQAAVFVRWQRRQDLVEPRVALILKRRT